MRHLVFLLMMLAGVGGAAADELPAGVPLTRAFAEPLLARALAEAGVAAPFELTIEQPALPLANPGRTATAIAVEELRRDAPSERFAALLVGRVAGEVRFRLPTQGRVVPLVEVPVLARPLAAGERIGAGDLALVAMRPKQLRPGSLTDSEALLGAEATRPLLAGRTLGARDVRPPRLVNRGRAVRLVYAGPGLRLTAQGAAQDDGALGDLVRVVNPDSRRLVQGVVSGPDEVTVGAAMLQVLAR